MNVGTCVGAVSIGETAVGDGKGTLDEEVGGSAGDDVDEGVGLW